VAESPIAKSAKDEAERVFRDVWLHTAGPNRFPVDPIRVAHRLGIKVFRVLLNPDVSGALVKEPGKDVAILLNETDSDNRQRFTCAHEIGHYVKRGTAARQSIRFVDERSKLSGLGTDPEEIFANQFGACLLMPEDEIRGQFRKHKQVYALTRHFGVSADAIGLRLKALGLPSL